MTAFVVDIHEMLCVNNLCTEIACIKMGIAQVYKQSWSRALILLMSVL